MKVVYLFPKSPLKTELHSDTLFGIICWAIRLIYDEKVLEDLLEKLYNRTPPFLISSCFPFTYHDLDQIKHHYLPKPILPVSANEKEYKKLNKCTHVSEEVFNEIINAKRFYNDYLNDESLWKELENDFQIQHHETIHNSINRLSDTTEKGGLYSFSEKQFRETGLYFLVQGQELDKLQAALAFLSHYGFGGDTSIGKGSFRVKMADCQFLEEPDNGNCFVNLSLYVPEQSEIDGIKNNKELAYYDLMSRSGKLAGELASTGKYAKRPVITFSEGSVLPNFKQKQDYYGKTLIIHKKDDLTDYNVYYYGYSFAIKMNLN